jgi:uncharacterized protein YkwD
MHRLALLFASLALVFATLTWGGTATIVAAQDGGYSPDGEEAAFVDLINGYRGSLGLGALTINYQLGAAADYHSYDMATNNYFDHYLFDGTDPGTNIQNFGYTAYPWGETIAAGMASAQEVLTAWQNSPEHDASMRNPQFTEIGIGRFYGEGSYYGWYWTATYGGGMAPDDGSEVLAAPVEAPVVDVPVAEAPETTTIVNGVEASGNVTMDGATDSVQEPPTVITNEGGVVELEQNAVNADGDRAVSTGVNPVANGTGDTIIYGDINTGGVLGESIVYEPPSYTVTGETPAPAPAASAPAPVTTEYIPPAEPVYTDPTLTETTTTVIETNDGNGRAMG